MNLNNANYILTILQEGSFSAAAQKLYISQPALSQTVKKVEKSLGTQIFTRIGNRLKLTYAGERYVQTARQILALENNLQNEINEINKENCGLLRFGIPIQMSYIVIPDILGEFQKKYPKVVLHIEEKGSSALIQMVADGELDIALARHSGRQNSMVFQFVQEERIVLLAGEGAKIYHKYENGTELALSDARDEAFVYMKKGHNSRTIQDKMTTNEKLVLKKMIELDSFETANRVVLNCGGVMLAPLSLIRKDIPALGRGHLYPLKYVENNRHTYILFREDTYLTRYMKDWISAICNFYQTYNGGLYEK
ncbi:MAG: LysR family transcriptional regulator [Desulfitobacteriaceae bacterium]|jgi:DNA-binding transcriptional LysR family regulator|nr:LysR family transcriptional regulator [Desulfitobacteriaceae bacterium]MDD4401899.1 LysR family transcriptional regulator [Desulfitobacteriaceae bacterium]